MVTEQDKAVKQPSSAKVSAGCLQQEERKASVRRARRVVLKLGTKVLLALHQNSGSPELSRKGL